jgi:anti-anti-sigma factor
MIRNATDVEGAPGVCRLVLTGKVYAPDAPAVEAEIKKAVARGAKSVVLACYSLEQIDSAVLSAIIAGLECVKSAGNGQVVFIGVNPTVRRILELTKMNKFFPMVENEPAALALIGGAGKSPEPA